MLTKILEYEFSLNGEPIDRSGQNNHGVKKAVGFTPNGVDQGTGSVIFFSDDSRITVPYSESWEDINTVKVEATIMIDSLEQRANIAEIEQSLALFVRKDGVITFTYYAPEDADDDIGDGNSPSIADSFVAQPPLTGSTDPFDTEGIAEGDDEEETPPKFIWQGVNTDVDFSPDGQKHIVPIGEYFSVTAIHDGVGSMRIYLNGELAGARYDIPYPVPSLVSPGIVSIGAWPHDGRYTLRGEIDAITIWKYDPRFPYRQFFCRPMSQEAQDSWKAVLSGLSDLLREESKAIRLLDLVECLAKAETKLLRNLISLGDQTIRDYEEFAGRYVKLWCRGDISGDSMKELGADLQEWLYQTLGSMYDDYIFKALRCLADARDLELCSIAGELGDYDRDWQGFIELGMNNIDYLLCGPPRDESMDYAEAKGHDKSTY